MDAVDGILRGGDATGAQRGRGGGAGEVFAQGGDGVGRLADASGGGDDDEVGGQGALGEEGVDQALADAQADAAGGWVSDMISSCDSKEG